MESEIVRLLNEIAAGQGRLEGKVDSMKDHIDGVSAKADRHRDDLKAEIEKVDARLGEHAKADDAHGRKARSEVWAQIGEGVKWGIGILIAGGGLIIATLELLKRYGFAG